MKYLVIVFLFFACTKTVNTPNAGTPDSPMPVKVNSNVFTSDFLVKDLDSSVLSITLEPVLFCYQHQEDDKTRPCDIFVAATVNLSKPLQTGLQIEFLKKNPYADSLVVIIVQPNQTELIFQTGFSLINNVQVPDIFRIQKVTPFSPVN